MKVGRHRQNSHITDDLVSAEISLDARVGNAPKRAKSGSLYAYKMPFLPALLKIIGRVSENDGARES